MVKRKTRSTSSTCFPLLISLQLDRLFVQSEQARVVYSSLSVISALLFELLAVDDQLFRFSFPQLIPALSSHRSRSTCLAFAP